MRLAIASALLLTTCAVAADVPRSDCFPIERLASEDQVLADRILQDALDSVSLYTLITGLKPISTAWQQTPKNLDTELATHFRVKAGDLSRLLRLQRLLAVLTCGDDLLAGAVALPLGKDPSQERIVWPWMAHRPRIREILSKYPQLYSQYFITPYMDPSTMLYTIVTAPDRGNGDRMLGDLLGYPAYAVEFYAEQGQQRSQNGELLFGFMQVEDPAVLVKRGRIQVFSYTVPKDHTTPNQEDLDIRAKASLILEEYSKRRSRYMGKSKVGAAELLRDWFCDSRGMCNPSRVNLNSPK